MPGEPDGLEDLLRRMSGDNTAKVETLVRALDAAGLQRGSALLEETEPIERRRVLQRIVSCEARKEGCCIPETFVDDFRMAVQDSRLSFSGFPDPPPRTQCRVLFSAPHSIHLQREGHQTHKPEAYTSHLARDFAQTIGGAFLTWTMKEEARVKDLNKATGEPDPTNKDPNFTHCNGLNESAWTRNLREVRFLFGPGTPCLHVDLHGCKDPGPDGGSHLVVGLRAMEFAGCRGVEELRAELATVFAVALRGWSVNVRPMKVLTGALEDDWRTLTQQSLSEEGGAWTHAVQLEMSRTLRNRLARSKELRDMVARAIRIAWVLSASANDQPDENWQFAVLEVRRWLGLCKKHSAKKSTGKRPAGTQADAGNGEVGIAGAGGARAVHAGARGGCGAPKLGSAERRTGSSAGSSEAREQEDFEDDARVDDGGTANTEPTVVPCPTPIEDLEPGLLQKAMMLSRRCASPGRVPAMMQESSRAAPPPIIAVRVLRDWLRVPIGGSAYFIVGTWNDWKPEQMKKEGEVQFVSSVEIGENGWESFQILLEGKWDTAIYPSIVDANPWVSHKVQGPDGKGHGKNWTMGCPDSEKKSHKKNVVEKGEMYKIIAAVGSDQAVTRVTWLRVKTRDAGN